MRSDIHKLLSGVIDRDDGYIEQIPVEHHRIHQGKTYTVSFTDTKGSTTHSDLVISTTALSTGLEIHIIAGVTATNVGQVALYGDPIISSTAGSTGTSVSIYNHHRGSTSVTSVVALKNPVFTSTTTDNLGDLLEVSEVGGGKNNFTIGGETAQRNEWIFPAGKKHLFRFDPDNNATDLSWVATFYEASV